MRIMSEHGERVDLEFLRQKLELEYVLVFWYSVHALLLPSEEKNILISPLPVSSEQPSDNDFDYSKTLATRAFKSSEVMNLPRVSL